jgi:cell division protein FtsL
MMKLAITTVFLFCLIFALAIPVKIENNKRTILISQENALEDSISVMRYDLALLEKSIDSLSSRKRIDAVAPKLGLGIYGVATKITEYAK